MYVGLIVSDECERSMKNQASKVVQMDFAIGSNLSRKKQLAKRATCKAHN